MANEATGRAVSDDEELRVRADPDKLFFIDNLIKDIELIPAILDLADNSVDAARKAVLESLEGALEDVSDEEQGALPPDSFSGYTVDLTVKPDGFEIKDNCSGIPLQIARLYAFRFGRPREFAGVPGSVGEFGVGMKRALFKLGERFHVESRSSTEWFSMTVDVRTWAAPETEGWDFQFDSAREGMVEATPDERGTTIRVDRLHESVGDDFADELVLSLLREQLRLRHQVAIDLGLTITLNGRPLRGLRPMLLTGPTFQPIRRTIAVHERAGTVTCEIIAGIVRSDRRDAALDDARGENFTSSSEAGWWVFCNNRLLLIADKSSETGWGGGAAAYHPQYRLFRGYVYMSSLNPSLLPWNTTKTGVDSDSRVWRQVQTQMLSALVEVQGVLNRLKKEREESVDDEVNAQGPDGSSAPYTRAVAQSNPAEIRDLPFTPTLVLPPVPKRTSPTRRKAVQKIQYDVPRDRFEEAMSVGFDTAAELGRRSFDYFYKREVENS